MSREPPRPYWGGSQASLSCFMHASIRSAVEVRGYPIGGMLGATRCVYEIGGVVPYVLVADAIVETRA